MQDNEQPINKKELLLNFMCSALNVKISTSVEGHCTDYIYLFKINRNEKIDPFALKLEHKVRDDKWCWQGLGESGQIQGSLQLKSSPSSCWHHP